jgi:hypothetical protein
VVISNDKIKGQFKPEHLKNLTEFVNIPTFYTASSTGFINND